MDWLIRVNTTWHVVSWFINCFTSLVTFLSYAILITNFVLWIYLQFYISLFMGSAVLHPNLHTGLGNVVMKTGSCPCKFSFSMMWSKRRKRCYTTWHYWHHRNLKNKDGDNIGQLLRLYTLQHWYKFWIQSCHSPRSVSLTINAHWNTNSFIRTWVHFLW